MVVEIPNNQAHENSFVHYSLNDIFEMNSQDILQKRFKFQKREELISSSSGATSQSSTSLTGFEEKYVLIQKIELTIGYDKKEVLKISDISKSILYDQAIGEKEILTLINATVSHEMRNPCNSIEAQNIRQAQINSKLKTIIKEDLAGNKNKYLRSKLKVVAKEYDKSFEIQNASTKMLKFLVNDILDLAQMRQGKFRKDLHNFDLRKIVKEITLIQKM